MRELAPLSDILSQGASPEDILRMLLPDLQVIGRTPVGFRCTCSRERYERILLSLGEVELESMIEELLSDAP